MTLVVSSSAAVAWSATTASRREARCKQVRAHIADREALLDAAVEEGGLTPDQTRRVEFERAINRAALKRCRMPSGDQALPPAAPADPAPADPGGSVVQPPSQSAPASSAPAANPADPAGPAPGTGSTTLTGFPTAANTGVPAGWVPARTQTADLRVTQAGAVVENVRLQNASLIIEAPNVTVRKVEVVGGRIVNDAGSRCNNGLVLDQVSVVRAANQTTRASDPPAISTGGYTARRVKIDGLSEGFRVGGNNNGCGEVTIENSFANVRYPDECGDWHGDGIQGYAGPKLTVRNVTLNMVEGSGCGGTAPFFYPGDQGNASVDINGLMVSGGGYPFRLGTGGSVRGLRVVDKSWYYGPVEVKCSALAVWDAQVVAVDAARQPARTVRALACGG